jgi:nitroimidazol reductase NimA-like FMN-containing flavoprotein (pyridoxamine 5'-phosphate oxidase superfamily)
MERYEPTPLTTLRRGSTRARYERETVHHILDEAVFCHVSFATLGRPACIPMAFARLGESIVLHGSTGNRALRALRDGAEACVSVTLLDGLVLGRSAFRTSVNYRSVVVYGRAEEVEDPAEKQAALRSIVEAAIPGRWQDVRHPSETELQLVMVLRIPLVEVSAKVRTGPPADKEEDYALGCWAGVIPLHQSAAAPVADPRLPAERPPPRYATHYQRPAHPPEEAAR